MTCQPELSRPDALVHRIPLRGPLKCTNCGAAMCGSIRRGRGGDLLMCGLPPGHEGPHYHGGISWKTSKLQAAIAEDWWAACDQGLSPELQEELRMLREQNPD